MKYCYCTFAAFVFVAMEIEALAFLAEEKDAVLTEVSAETLNKEIAKLRGNHVAVYFWSVFSPPDVHLLKQYVELKEKTKGKVAFVPVLVVDSADLELGKKHARRILKGRKGVFYVLVDKKVNGQTFREKWSVSGPPSFVFYDAKGSIDTVFDLAKKPFSFPEIAKKIEMCASSK